jgi:pimeloyl-ACP methyl ester carboxylesterase
VEGYKIHYVEAGAGEPVILIPGSWSTYRAWNRIIPLLSDYYRLLALDYVGTGDSDKPKKGFRYTVQEQANLTAKMIEKLELGRVHLIGGSYGGAAERSSRFDFGLFWRRIGAA